MIDQLLADFRADPPADDTAMSRSRARLVHHATTGRARRPRWRIPAMIAATAGVAAGLLILPATRDSGPTADAVVKNPDGTVTLELTDVKDLVAANKEFRELGVRAEVVVIQSPCDPADWAGTPMPTPDDLFLERPTDRRHLLTFRPDKIPADAKIVFVVRGVTVWISDPDTPVKLVDAKVSGELYPVQSGTCVDESIVR